VIGQYWASIAAMAGRCGLGLLVCLCAPVHVWGITDGVGPKITLHIEQDLLRGSAPADSGQKAPVHLPFLDQKTYQTDILSLSTVAGSDDTAAHKCADGPCQSHQQATADSVVVRPDPSYVIDLSSADRQAAQPLTSERYIELLEKSAYASAVDMGIVLVMRQMPASFTKWTADRLTEPTPLKQWQKNTGHPPVIDHDTATMNASHAYSGSGYYTLCRNIPGFSGPEMQHKLECLGYAILMSTFQWEYGLEAFQEIPSIQDLIVTPLGGAVLGELFHLLQQKILDNNGELLGSKLLGRVVIVLLNPLEEAVQVLRKIAGPVAEQWDLRLAVGYGNIPPNTLQASQGPARTAETMLQLQISGKWPGGKRTGYRK
jgi:Domain of unknown function (DUF3943)